ncbi:HORMA domain [Trinorchestia longiramus]|nr:HORMA domain [Trinorchestia longiramus]
MKETDYSISSSLLCELLEVSIHQILYSRALYPRTAFQSRRKYNIPVQMCLHPGVCVYIQSVVEGAKPLLQDGTLQSLQLAVTAPETGSVLEKFTFQLSQTSIQPHELRDAELARLEESFRALCLKLSISDNLLKPLPPRCSFKILLQVPLEASSSLHCKQIKEDGEGMWIASDTGCDVTKASKVVPLKSFTSALCQVQIYVEQTAADGASTSSSS